LAIKSDRPFLRGRVDINQIVVAASETGNGKMTLDSSFAIANARNSSEMREKLEGFSRHAEGQPEQEDATAR
jgi:hypothetical protein